MSLERIFGFLCRHFTFIPATCDSDCRSEVLQNWCHVGLVLAPGRVGVNMLEFDFLDFNRKILVELIAHLIFTGQQLSVAHRKHPALACLNRRL